MYSPSDFWTDLHPGAEERDCGLFRSPRIETELLWRESRTEREGAAPQVRRGPLIFAISICGIPGLRSETWVPGIAELRADGRQPGSYYSVKGANRRSPRWP